MRDKEDLCLILLCVSLIAFLLYCQHRKNQKSDDCDIEVVSGKVTLPETRAGIFTFYYEDNTPANASMRAKFIPDNGMTVMSLDLETEFRKNMGKCQIQIPSDTAYNILLVNGNYDNALKLRGLTSGSFLYRNDNSIKDLQSGITYSLKSPKTPVVSEIDDQRQKTIAFSAAFKACPDKKLSLNHTEINSHAVRPSIRTFMSDMVGIGGP